MLKIKLAVNTNMTPYTRQKCEEKKEYRKAGKYRNGLVGTKNIEKVVLHYILAQLLTKWSLAVKSNMATIF